MIPKSRETVQRELLQEAESLIQELLEWQQTHPESDFAGMEQFVLQLRRRFGQRVTEALLEIQEQRVPVVAAVCPGCGNKGEYKDTQRLTFESLLGPITVTRGYYYCPSCQEGQYPLDTQLQLPGKHWSEGVARAITWLNGHTQTYGETADILSRLTDASISKSSAWRLVQTWGGKIGDEIAAEEATIKAQAREWSTPGGATTSGSRMGVATDGGYMYILGEGWKEFKAGCVFEVALQEREMPHTGDVEACGHAVNLSYTVHLGSCEPVGWQLWTEAHRRDWQTARDGIVIGDGAKWIWNLRDEHFPQTEMLVDWYHATEHLGTVKQQLYPDATVAASRWYNAQEEALYQGHADRVAQEIRALTARHPELADDLQREADYFHTNHRRMQYQDLRDAGWPIGSGMIESGVKRFKARFDAAGMRWSRDGAENLLPVRAAVLSGPSRFEQLWQRARAA